MGSISAMGFVCVHTWKTFPEERTCEDWTTRENVKGYGPSALKDVTDISEKMAIILELRENEKRSN